MAVQETLDKLSFGQEKRIKFYCLMRDFIKDGIPVYEALKDIEAGSRQMKMFPRTLVAGLMSAMRGGNGAPASLGEALSKWVEPVEAALIDAGQRSGKLETGLHEVVDMMMSKRRIKSTIVGAMIYPVMLLFMLGGFLWMVSSEIIPIMADIVPRAKWPVLAQILGHIADHATLILALLFGSFFAATTAFAVTASRWCGEARDYFDRHIMPWSSYCQIQSAMVLVSISMMVESGVPVGSAIGQLHMIGTAWQRNHFERMQSRMRKGKTEAESIVGLSREESMFDPETAWEVRMYGARTSFARSMKNLAMRALERLEGRLKSQAIVLRNVLLFMVSAMLALTFASFTAVTMSISKRGGI